MLESVWNSILDITSLFVIPDWGALVALLPVVLLVIVAIWLILTVRRFATAGPTRRGKTRLTPVAPAGIHMPGPSLSPFFVAAGAGLLFFGLVVGGTALLVGVVALLLSLLYWGAEALTDYDRTAVTDRDAAHATNRLPAVVHAGPPPGVHMPGPSFRPILASLGVAVLLFGLVFGGWLLAVGVLLTIVTLLGWLFDARREYVKVVEADQTGHLENIEAPRWPRRVLWVGGLLVAIALLMDNGIVPPRTEETAAGGPGASGQPGTAPGSGAPGELPSGSPPGSGEPPPGGPAGDVAIVAQGVQFTTTEVTAPAGDFTIAFDNQDPNTPHDVDIMGSDGSKLFDGDFFPGPEVRVYEVTGIEPGSYEFICSIHPGMKGTIAVQ